MIINIDFFSKNPRNQLRIKGYICKSCGQYWLTIYSQFAIDKSRHRQTLLEKEVCLDCFMIDSFSKADYNAIFPRKEKAIDG